MCIKTIYHNTYADGARDVTERVETCTPGFLCAHPRLRDVDRTLSRPKYSSSGRASPAALAPPAPYYASDVRPVSPITPPGSRGSDGSDHRRRKSLYLDGNKIIEVRHERSPRRHREPRAPVVLEPKPPASPSRRVPFAPEPPAPRTLPMAIPSAIKRASTMPYGTGLETPPERGRRPIIVEEPAPRTPRSRRLSDAVPLGPVDVLEHASSGRRRQTTRRDSSALLHPHSRRAERSPQGYGSAEDDAERRARRRRRRDARAEAAGLATSVPTFSNTDVYGSSWGSSGASSPLEASPAVAAVKKHLRWEDQLRAQQNDRIRSRPKLARAATATGAGVAVSAAQAEVKSILKNPSGGASPVAGPARVPEEELAALYRSVEGLSLAHGEGQAREASAERLASAERRARAAEALDSEAYIDRLRGRFDSGRFSMPPRRFTAGSGNRRRTEIWYPDEGRYKYL